MLTISSGWSGHAGDLSSALLTMVSRCAVSTESSRFFVQNSLPRSHRHIDVSSFTSLYSIQSERAPALLVIEDTDGSVFGALLSSPIRFSTRPGVSSHLKFFAGRANTFMEPGRVFCSPANLAGTSTHGPATTKFFHQKFFLFFTI